MSHTDKVPDLCYKRSGNRPSIDEVVEMQRKYLAGDKEANEWFLENFVALVQRIANTYKGMNRALSIADLVQEGLIGLYNSIPKYVPDRPDGTRIRFSTYATWWIRQRITRQIEQYGRTIRVPVWAQALCNKVERARSYLRNTLDRDPTTFEIAEELGTSEENVIRALLDIDTQDKIVTLDRRINDDSDDRVEDIIPSPDTPSVDQIVRQLFLRDEVQRLFIDQRPKCIKPRDIEVVLYLYGLDSNTSQRTLAEVAAHFKISRERVRQIDSRVKRIMRRTMDPEVGRR